MNNSPQADPFKKHTFLRKFVFRSGKLSSRQVGWWSGLVVTLTGALALGWATWQTASAQQSFFNISTVAGSSGGSGLSAELRNARGVAVSPTNTAIFYIADTGNHVIRKVDTSTNSVTIAAGKLGEASTSATDTNGDGGLATSATLKEPNDVVTDQSGNLYISDTGNHRIRRVNVTDGTIQTIIGNGTAGDNGGSANGPVLSEPRGLLLANDSLYIADSASHRIYQVNEISGITANTNVTGIAGNGSRGADGDGGLATAASLDSPQDIALNGNTLYIADTNNHKIRKVTKNLQNISIIDTYAGTGVPGHSGDTGPALNMQLNAPYGVAIGSQNTVYITDSGNNRIRVVDIDGFMTSVAGTGAQGFNGDGTPGTNFALNAPSLAIFSSNSLVFLDTGNRRLRRLAGATLSTIVSDGSGGFSGDTGLATQAKLDGPAGIAVDSVGNWYIADSNNQVIRRVNKADGKIETIAGLPGMASVNPTDLNGDGGDAKLATFKSPSAVALDGAGNIYIADTGNRRIRKITKTDGKIETVMGQVGSTTFGATTLLQPTGVALDTLNNLYVADPAQHIVIGQNGLGTKTLLAGKASTQGFGGDGGLAENARLNRPTGLAVVGTTIYVADTNNHRIRRIDRVNDTYQISSIVPKSAGVVQIIPRPGYEGDGGLADFARLNAPTAVAADSAGTLFIMDRGNNRVRRVDGTTRIINTVVGNGDIGFSGDGGPALSAALGQPLHLAIIPNTNPIELLIADTGNNRIRKTVEPPNVAPVLTSPGDKTVNEGATLSFTLSATDSNAGQTLTYSMTNGPSGATLNAQTGAFSYTPGFDVVPNQPNAKVDFNVTFTVTDSAATPASNSKAVKITVNNVNGKPVVDSGTIPATVEATGPNGGAVPFSGSATDPDGDSMTYLWTDTRPNQQPVSLSKELAFSSTLALGQHSIIFTATDVNQNSASTAAKVVLVQDTTKPTFASIPGDIAETITAGTSKVVTFSLPTATDLVSGVRPVTAQPASGSTFPLGVTTVTFSASDAAGNTATATFKVTVTCTGSNCAGGGGGDNGASGYNIAALAGTASFGTTGDGSNATVALLKEPRGVAVDASGNVYLADSEAHTIRRVNAQGVISLFAGTGQKGFAGDSGAATSARFNHPTGLAVDTTRNVLFIADTGNHRLRRVDLGTNTITTLAGTGLAGLNADGVATSTQLSYPQAVTVDGSGIVYIADTGNHRIVRVSNGQAAAFAGNGQVGNTGDGGAALQAKFNTPTGLAVTTDGGTLYIVDRGNNRVRRITGGTVSNFAGTGAASTSGDNGQATAATLNAPTDVLVDSSGRVFISETDGERIRRVGTDGKIETIAGSGVAGNSGDGGAATSAALNGPTALARNATSGVLYLCDTGNLRVRQLTPNGSTNRAPVPDPVSSASLTIAQTLSVALTASDADGDPVTFTLVPALSFATVTNANAAARTATLFINPAGANAGVYSVRVQAADSKGGTGLTAEFTITVTDPTNRAPIALMKALNATYFAPNGSQTATVALDDNGSSDPDGDPLTFEWFDGVTKIATGKNTTAALSIGQHSIRLIVTDSKGASGSTNAQNITVQGVTQSNRAPVAAIRNLPPEVFAANGVETQVSLDGSTSSDPDGDPLTYVWFNGANQIATGQTATVTLPVGFHQIKLLVTDDKGASNETAPQELRVSATPSEIEVTSVSPNTGKQGRTVDITVNGRGFNAASYVTINKGGVTVTTTYVSSTKLLARLVITNVALTGPRAVTVTNPGAGSATLSNAFSIQQ